jgi:glycosyl transferase family 25
MDIPVFVINLRRSVERRDHTTKQLNELEVPFQIIEAVDGVELSDHEIRYNNDFGIFKTGFYSRYLRKEEIGCVLSHLKIYRKMVDEKIGLACILEDDNDYLKEFKDLLINADLKITDWDILYLGHRSGCTMKVAQSRKRKQLIPFKYYVGEAIEVPHGSHAYIINIEAARKILKQVYPIKVPFDLYLGNSPAIGMRTFLLTPPSVFTNTNFVSTIQNDQNVILTKPFWANVRRQIKKSVLWFHFFHAISTWIRIISHTIFRYLRKTGIIKNHYAKI